MTKQIANVALSMEQIVENWNKFLEYIQQYVKPLPGDNVDRAAILLSKYDGLSDRIATMPASIKVHYHNCFVGGYIDHVNRVIENAIKFHEMWHDTFEFEPTYTINELVFAAINHDLGKIGSDEYPCYVDNTSSWHRERGELFSINPANDFMPVAERSLYTLQHWGVKCSMNETLGIRLHDGLYDEGNKPYYIGFAPQSKLRTNLPYVLHQADLTAARYEYTRWLKLNPYTTTES